MGLLACNLSGFKNFTKPCFRKNSVFSRVKNYLIEIHLTN